MKQPEALRLADCLTDRNRLDLTCDEAAAELRRLHAIIDFKKAKEEREPHISGHLFCMGCSHEWTAVWKPGTTEFECPECKSMRGRNKFDVSPAPGSQLWSCIECDNQLFSLMPDRVHCPGCGKQWGYEELAT